MHGLLDAFKLTDIRHLEMFNFLLLMCQGLNTIHHHYQKKEMLIQKTKKKLFSKVLEMNATYDSPGTAPEQRVLFFVDPNVTL